MTFSLPFERSTRGARLILNPATTTVNSRNIEAGSGTLVANGEPEILRNVETIPAVSIHRAEENRVDRRRGGAAEIDQYEYFPCPAQ